MVKKDYVNNKSQFILPHYETNHPLGDKSFKFLQKIFLVVSNVLTASIHAFYYNCYFLHELNSHLTLPALHFKLAEKSPFFFTDATPIQPFFWNPDCLNDTLNSHLVWYFQKDMILSQRCDTITKKWYYQGDLIIKGVHIL